MKRMEDQINQDVLSHILNNYIPLSDARRFANTCQRFLFFSQKLKPVLRRANAEAHQFLTCVLNSDAVRAREMLLVDPGLMWEAQSISEHEQVSGLQLARNLGDADMCEMMLDCAAGNIAVTLPVNTCQKKPFDVRNFDDIADAIAKAARTDQQLIDSEFKRHQNPEHQMTALSLVMDAFRKLCDAHGEMTPQDVMNAIQAFVNHWDKLETYGEVNFFFLQVIGYIERLCPVWFRQALVEGINNLLQPNAVLRRVTECAVNNVNYPLVVLIPCSGLGFDFACDDVGLRVSANGTLAGGGWVAARWCVRIEKFCRAAESKFDELSKRVQPNASEPELKKLKN